MALGGVIDTLRVVYQVDVVDKGTKPLLASERAVQRSVMQTSRELAKQDAVMRRSGSVATSTSGRKQAAFTRETRTVRTAATAMNQLTAAERSQASVAGRVASSTGQATAALERQSRASERLTRLERARAAAHNAASAAAATASKVGGATAGVRATAGDKTSSAVAAAAPFAAAGLKGAKLGAAGLAVALGYATKQGVSFEKQMDNVQGKLFTTEKNMKGLSNFALKLGANTQFSAAEAASAMEMLAAGGFSVNEIYKILPGTLSLAAASGTDLASSAEIQTTAIRGFGLASKDAGHVADVLATTTNKSAASMADLGQTLPYVASTAKATGTSFEQVAAAAGILANAGIDGSRSGTALRTSMLRLTDPTNKMLGVFDDLGLRASDLAAVPLPEVIGKIAGGLHKLPSRGEKVGAISAIFGKEAAPAMLNLMAKGETSITKMAQALATTEGSAKKAADVMRDNVAGSWDNFTGSVETASIKLTARFMPALKGALDIAAKGVNRGTGLLERVGTGVGRGVSGRTREADGAIGVGQKIGATARTIGVAAYEAGKQLLDAFKPALPFFRNVLLPLLSGVAQGVLGGVVAAFKVLIPVVKVAATVLGFVGRVAAPLRGVFKFLGQVIGFVFGGAILRVLGAIGKLGRAFKVLGAPIRALGGTFKLAGRAVTGIGNLFAGLAGRIGTALRGLPGIAGRTVNAIFNWFRRGAKRLSSIAVDMVSAVARPFGKVGARVITAARGGLSDIYGFFKRVGGTIVRAIVGGISSAAGGVKDALKSLVPGPIKSLFGANRRGGIVKMAAGGLVPIAAAGGEMLVHGGQGMTIPGDPRRDGTFMLAPAGSAVLTGDGQARMAAGASLAQAISAQAPHFAKGGRVTPGKYVSTAYGPPWGGIQGTGTTRTGVKLRSGPKRYIVAVDPSLIPLKSKVYAQPNPFNYSGAFSAEDTGGAIKGRRIDFYDWRGRRTQNKWGRRSVTISSKGIGKAAGSVAATAMLGGSETRGGVIADAFEQGRAAGREGLTRGLIGQVGNPILGAIREATTVASPTTKGVMRTGAGTAVVGNVKGIDVKGSKPGFGVLMSVFRGLYGNGLYVMSGNRPGSRIAGSGGISNHASGNAIDITHKGIEGASSSRQPQTLNRLGASRMDRLFAYIGRKIKRPPRRDLLWRTMTGGNHYNHIHLGMDPSATGTVSAARKYVGGFRKGGVVGGALNAGVSRALTGAGDSLKALDDLIGRALETRLLTLRGELEAKVRQGGSATVVKRLQSVISVVDFELGRRIGRIEDEVEKRVALLDRAKGFVERSMRAMGVPGEGVKGLGVLQNVQALETKVRAANVRSLTSALQRATASKNTNAVREITASLQTAQDELQESLVRQIELARDKIRAMGAERISNAQFWTGLAQAGGSMLDVVQRRNQTADTPEGMRQRADYMTQGVIPQMQGQLQAHVANAQLMASIGDLEGWRSAVQDAAQAAVDIASAQADAADLMREASARAAQDLVDLTSHQAGMASRGLQRLEVEQRLAGTFESGGMARADFIRRQIVPAMDAELIALEAQRMEAQSQGNAMLVRQLAETIFDKQTEILQANLDANEQTASNTDALKEFGGSTAFSYRDEVRTDLDVMKARVGA